jgi:hypothetical protein
MKYSSCEISRDKALMVMSKLMKLKEVRTWRSPSLLIVNPPLSGRSYLRPSFLFGGALAGASHPSAPPFDCYLGGKLVAPNSG